MNLIKKITAVGLSASLLSFVVVAPAVQAAPDHKSTQKTKATLSQLLDTKKLVALGATANAAVDLSTELNCMDHTLIAKVTNKTSAKITPKVTFNSQNPSFPPQSDMPIEPGKTGNYIWNYSGNNLLVDVKVQVDGQPDAKLSPTLYCNEPVSFQVMATSESAVTGTLSNNSSFVAQTVYTRVNGGDVRVETLQPNESRLIALPFNSMFPDPQSAFVTIGTDAGYQGTYTVDLDLGIIRPLPRL